MIQLRGFLWEAKNIIGMGGEFGGEASWERERVEGVCRENIGKNLRDIG